MKRHLPIQLFMSVPLVILAIGCSSLQPIQGSVPPPATALPVSSPVLDPSNSLLIVRAIAAIDVVSAVSQSLKPPEKIIIVDMGTPDSAELTSLNNLVDDDLTSQFVAKGYAVLERAEKLVAASTEEHGPNYSMSPVRHLPPLPTLTLIQSLEKNDISSSAGSAASNLPDLLKVYRQLDQDYRSLSAQLSTFEPADVMLSFRILEVRLSYSTTKQNVGGSSPTIGTTVANPFSQDHWSAQIARTATARIFLRVIDIKTGQIRFAQSLQGQSSAQLSVLQNPGESDAAFDSRLRDFTRSAPEFSYSWLDQTQPNTSEHR